MNLFFFWLLLDRDIEKNESESMKESTQVKPD